MCNVMEENKQLRDYEFTQGFKSALELITAIINDSNYDIEHTIYNVCDRMKQIGTEISIGDFDVDTYRHWRKNYYKDSGK